MNLTFKINLDLTWSCQNEPWYIFNAKTPAYRRNWISWLMLIEVPIPKFTFFVGETSRWNYGGTDKQTDIWRGRRGGGSLFTCQHMNYHMSVQWNMMQPSSIVQFSTAVGWFTKKYMEGINRPGVAGAVLETPLSLDN